MSQTIVVKIGSSVALTRRQKLDVFRMTQLAKQIKALQEREWQILLVVSGAVSTGQKILGEGFTNDHLVNQLYAGIGQSYITSGVREIFANEDLLTSQILLTKTDLEDGERRGNLQKVLALSATRGAIPIINENDIVDLNSFGGNDFLASRLAHAIRADCLIVLTDVDGVISKDGKTLSTIRDYESNLADLKKNYSVKRVGGIGDKIIASCSAARYGIKTIIANGKAEDILVRVLLKGEKLGTEVLRETIT